MSIVLVMGEPKVTVSRKPQNLEASRRVWGWRRMIGQAAGMRPTLEMRDVARSARKR